MSVLVTKGLVNSCVFYLSRLLFDKARPESKEGSVDEVTDWIDSNAEGTH